MNRRGAAALVALAAVITIAGLFWLVRSGPPGAGDAGETAGVATPAPEEEPEAVGWQATLWLPGPGERIAPLAAELSSGSEPHARANALLTALLAARPAPPLAPLFDAPVEVAASVLTPDGVLYVDLRSESGGEPPDSGSAEELQRVYSIVHTVLRNEPSIRRVVLLWNGVQRPSLSGHVDTGHALGLLPGLEAQ